MKEWGSYEDHHKADTHVVAILKRSPRGQVVCKSKEELETVLRSAEHNGPGSWGSDDKDVIAMERACGRIAGKIRTILQALSMCDDLHFRVDTPALLKEICDNCLPNSGAILKIPMNIFKNLLAGVAGRAAELNDPIMNKLMFDLTLYDLPYPTSNEYREVKNKVYEAARIQFELEKSPTT